MTFHLNSHRTTDIKPEMLSGVQTGNATPHDKYNIRGSMPEQIEKTTFSCKDDKCKTLHLYWSGSRDLFIDEAHTALGILPVFFPCMLPTLLCGISYQYSLSAYSLITVLMVGVLIWWNLLMIDFLQS